MSARFSTPRHWARALTGALLAPMFLWSPAPALAQDCSAHPHFPGELGVFADRDLRDGARTWAGGARAYVSESVALHARLGSLDVPEVREAGRTASARVEARLPIDGVKLCGLVEVERSTWDRRMFGVDVDFTELDIPIGGTLGGSRWVRVGQGFTVHGALEGGARFFHRKADGEADGVRFLEVDPGWGTFVGARTTIAFRHYYLQAGVRGHRGGRSDTTVRLTVGHRFW